MASCRAWRVFLRRYTTVYKVVAVVGSLYIFLNLWNVEKINYEIKHQKQDSNLPLFKEEAYANSNSNEGEGEEEETNAAPEERDHAAWQALLKRKDKVPNDMRVEKRLDFIGDRNLAFEAQNKGGNDQRTQHGNSEPDVDGNGDSDNKELQKDQPEDLLSDDFKGKKRRFVQFRHDMAGDGPFQDLQIEATTKHDREMKEEDDSDEKKLDDIDGKKKGQGDKVEVEDFDESLIVENRDVKDSQSKHLDSEEGEMDTNVSEDNKSRKNSADDFTIAKLDAYKTSNEEVENYGKNSEDDDSVMKDDENNDKSKDKDALGHDKEQEEILPIGPEYIPDTHEIEIDSNDNNLQIVPVDEKQVSKEETGINADEELLMSILDHDKDADTFEVDLTGKDFSGVAFPPFVEYAGPDAPGEFGVAFKEEMTAEEKKERQEEYKTQYFDVWASRKMSVHRRVKEARPQKCLEQTYEFEMPTISVIIVFYNEAWSTLLRTIHSILDRCPQGAITEVILLDDCSDMGHLKEPLERYVQPMRNVRLIRANKRLGLIKARNLGFAHAKGEVMIFLDSHIECFEGWLEPLVAPIVADDKAVTFPVINSISKDDFGLNMVNVMHLGGLDLKTLSFMWVKGNENGSVYFDSPTMPGGLYAISRRWFRHLGAYDPDLHLWGGENIEISLKIWMCGGTLRLAQCSQMAHVFRTQSPIAKQHAVEENFRNSIRIAEVWLDDYKHFYYERTAYNLPDLGNVTSRKALRHNLQCHTFEWYLEKVYPQLIKINDLAGKYSGAITNVKSSLCMCRVKEVANLCKCDQHNIFQIWQLRSKGYLVVVDSVIDVEISVGPGAKSAKSLSLKTFKADPSARASRYTRWRYDSKKRLVRLGTKDCLDQGYRSQLVLSPCGNSTSQQWHVQTRGELRESHRPHVFNIDWAKA